MEWIDALRGQLVALDTAPLIYFIEEHPDYLPIVLPFFEGIDRGEIRVVTSTITLTEVLVHPLRNGDAALAQRYLDILLHTPALTIVPASETIAERAASLRAAHNLRTPDALQIATALLAGASGFVTNDVRLRSVPGVRIIVLQDVLAGP